MAFGAKEIREELEAGPPNPLAYAMAQDAFRRFYRDAGPATVAYLDDLKDQMKAYPDEDELWRESYRAACSLGRILEDGPGGAIVAEEAYRVVMDWLAP